MPPSTVSLSAVARVRQKQSEKSSHPEVPASSTLTPLPLGSDNFRHLFAHLHPDNCHPQNCPRVCLSSPLPCLSRQLSLPTPPTLYHGSSSSTTSSMVLPPAVLLKREKRAPLWSLWHKLDRFCLSLLILCLERSFRLPCAPQSLTFPLPTSAG